jgi:transcriptional regulator of heat shock response
MNERQEQILQWIVEAYIRTAEPVGSKFLCERYEADCSSATIRHDMSVLEKGGYLRQPHPSAGRVPTEKAYIHYLQCMQQPRSAKSYKTQLRQAIGDAQSEEAIVKSLAKAMVDLSGETVIVAFDPRWSYYTGVSNLFAKPDFRDLEVVCALSALLDRFDDVVAEIFEKISAHPEVRIGSENPFGKDMSCVIVKYTLPNHHVGLLGLIGPLRMDYQKNVALLQEAKEVLDEAS